MYVETDFILALLKDDDWLQQAAEEVYESNREELETSKYTLIELMILSYREGWNPLKIVSNASKLVEVNRETDDIKAAASHMEDKEMTPFDALHLVSSDDEKILSSDKKYDEYTERVALEELK